MLASLVKIRPKFKLLDVPLKSYTRNFIFSRHEATQTCIQLYSQRVAAIYYANFNTASIILPTPSWTSWTFVSHMNAGVVTTLFSSSTWISCQQSRKQHQKSESLHRTLEQFLYKHGLFSGLYKWVEKSKETKRKLRLSTPWFGNRETKVHRILKINMQTNYREHIVKI